MNIGIVKNTFFRLATIGNWSGTQLDIRRVITNDYDEVICDTRKRLPPGESLASILEKAVKQGRSMAGCDFSGMNLEGANLTDARLMKANFSGADLSDAILSSARLDRANFTGAVMIGTKCSYASMEGCDLTDAYMVDADFSCADMTDAEVNTNHTNPFILGADFHGAIWDRWDPNDLASPKVLPHLS